MHTRSYYLTPLSLSRDSIAFFNRRCLNDDTIVLPSPLFPCLVELCDVSTHLVRSNQSAPRATEPDKWPPTHSQVNLSATTADVNVPIFGCPPRYVVRFSFGIDILSFSLSLIAELCEGYRGLGIFHKSTFERDRDVTRINTKYNDEFLVYTLLVGVRDHLESLLESLEKDQ